MSSEGHFERIAELIKTMQDSRHEISNLLEKIEGDEWWAAHSLEKRFYEYGHEGGCAVIVSDADRHKVAKDNCRRVELLRGALDNYSWGECVKLCNLANDVRGFEYEG